MSAPTLSRQPPLPRSSGRLSLDPRVLRWLTLASTVSVVALIGSGGWVRLSGSGLGCPTWPDCTSTALVAPPQYHALVEFVNRCIITTVGVLIVATTVATFVVRPRRRDLRWFALGLVAGYLGEAVLGGVTVLLKLAPGLVAAHLVLAMAILADAVVLQWRANPRAGQLSWAADRYLGWLANLGLVAVSVAVAAGTVVAGSGPHSGAPGTPRFPLPFTATAEFHSVVGVFLLGVTVALLLALLALRAPPPVLRVAGAAVALVCIQAALGYATYFSGVQVDVTEAHILGAAVLFATLVRLRLALPAAAPATGLSWEARGDGSTQPAPPPRAPVAAPAAPGSR